MPLQNRVTPLGELIAVHDRGLVHGNRGCLHDERGRIRRPFVGTRWIACRLRFRGWRRRPLLQPGRYTELFFLDEATALAAGHRPCALCRREDYRELTALGPDRERRLHRLPLDRLPDGTFVLHDGGPHLVLADRLLRWTPAGYLAATPRRAGVSAVVITPPSLLALLRPDRQPVVPIPPPVRDPVAPVGR